MIKSNFDKILEGLPDSWGVFAFHRGEECLLFCKSGNIRFKLKSLFQRKDSDKAISELFLESDSLSYKVDERPIMALIREKIYLQKHQPTFQHRHLPWKEYSYLALDAHQFPFVTIKDDTNGNWDYIGPFRSRFFLSDVMDTYGRILKIPYCETDTFPCDRKDRAICNAYCLQSDNESEAHSKLSSLLKEAYIHPKNGILELVKSERDRYFDDLEFDKVDLLSDEIDLLKKYRDWLSFLYVAKNLDFETESLKVESCQISKVKLHGREYQFPIQNIEYRPNEALALNKDIVDECRIVYTHYKTIETN